MIAHLMLLNPKLSIEEATLYVSMATQQVLDYTNRKVLLLEMEMLAVELANLNYKNTVNNLEGITSRSEGAISETYADTSATGGIPPKLAGRLNRYRLLHAVKHHDS